jgi:hypothetical protein
MECISELGQTPTLLIIIEWKTLKRSWFSDEPAFLDKRDFMASGKGWNNADIS